MKISINWLKDYIPFDTPVDELADRLTMVGLEVENIYQTKPQFNNVVVGKIIQIKKHPSSEKLKVCRVDVGNGILQIVCGAPNVSRGIKVPVAKIGAILGDQNKIEAKSIRGIQSEGMICSERELQLSDDHSGILILKNNHLNIGDPFTIQSELKDSILDIDVTPNRPDCLSYIGIAREVGVILGKKISIPHVSIHEDSSLTADRITIEIQDIKACPRYCGRIVDGVKIGPSPPWLKNRLESTGIRSINNVVDVTNYVLMETGHPLHGFDYENIQNKEIIIRKARNGEQFTTLDEENRELNSNDLLICDGEKGVALAGIMGGINSEISNSTQSVFLESAYFNSMGVRQTAKRLGMSTEASQRFERGTDPNNTVYAINRAVQLITQVAGGKMTKGIVDVYPNPINPFQIKLRLSRIPDILGIEIPRKRIHSILSKLDLQFNKEEEPIQVAIPTFRPDLKREIDLIEEIVRHYGYDKIESKLTSVLTLNHRQNHEYEFTEKLRDILVGMGFLETINISMLSKKQFALLDRRFTPVQIQNPLSPDTMFLRTSITPNLLETIRWNNNRSINHLRIFEIGHIFSEKSNALPDEHLVLSGAVSGLLRSNPFWGEKNQQVNFHHLKGIIETVLDRLHMTDFVFKATEHPVLNSQYTQKLTCNNKVIGILGKMNQSTLQQWDIENDVFIFELFLKDLFHVSPQRVINRSITKYPPIKRDLAVVVDEHIPVGSLEKLIHQVGGKKLISVDLFDLYRGKQIPSDKKSVAFSLTFLSKSRTLKEEEIEPIMKAILNALKKTYSASLRS